MVVAGGLTVRQLLTTLADLELNGLDGESITLELFEKLPDELLESKLTETNIEHRRSLFIGAVFVLCRCFHFGGMVAAVAMVDALVEQLQGTLERAPETLSPFIAELTMLAVGEFLEGELRRAEAASEADDDSTHH